MNWIDNRMEITWSHLTDVQRTAAKKAALLRYEDGKDKPDRPGWKHGKCPVAEYFGIVSEIGVANMVGYDWERLCLYSPNRDDYHAPDIGGVIEVKAGSYFNDSDKDKGAELLVFVTPEEDWSQQFYCGYDTCGVKRHRVLTGRVEIRGWFDMADWEHRSHFGKRYKAAGDYFRNANTLPIFGWNYGDADVA